MNSKTADLVKVVRSSLEQYGGSLVFGKGRTLRSRDGLYFRGVFFQDPKPTIHIARNCDHFAEVLAHEFSHFLQYLTYPRSIWRKFDRASLVVDSYIEDKTSYSPTKVANAFRVVRWFERDCERWTIRVLKKFQIPTGTSTVQRAHWYIYYLHMVEKTGKWNLPLRANDPGLIRLMPRDFRSRSWETIPLNIEQAMMRRL